MPFYECFLRGENFPGMLIGEKGRVGFYTTRYVEAEDAAQAELKAIELLRGHDALEWRGDGAEVADARVYLEESVELDELPDSQVGLTWYAM